MSEEFCMGALHYVPADVVATNTWTEPSSAQWMVRGPNYLKQSGRNVVELKQPSIEAPYTCVGMNLYKSPMVLSHSSDKIMEFRRFLQQNCDEDDDTGMPKFLIMCFLFANFFRTEFYCVHQVFRRKAAHKGEDPALDAAVARFMAADDAAKNEQFKYMFHCVQAPSLLTGVIGSIGGERPVLIGRRLTTNYFRGKNYLEINMDLSSSVAATMAFSTALQSAPGTIFEEAYVFEAQHEEELPERILCTARWTCCAPDQLYVTLDEKGEVVKGHS